MRITHHNPNGWIDHGFGHGSPHADFSGRQSATQGTNAHMPNLQQRLINSTGLESSGQRHLS